MERTRESTGAVRWIVRAGLVLAGLGLWAFSALAGIVLILATTVRGKSDGWSLAAIAVLGVGYELGRRCFRRAFRRSSTTPGPIEGPRPSPPASAVQVVVSATVCLAVLLSVFALGVHDAGGLERLLLANRSHLAMIGWWLLLGLIALPIIVAIHEAGHVQAGALMGMRFSFVQVGPVALHRTPEGLRWRWNQPLPEGVLGLQSSIPVDDQVSTARLVAHAAGGSALNVVTAVLAWTALAVCGAARTLEGAVARDLVGAVGALSLLGTLNLIPFRTPQGRLSDGARIRLCLRRGGASLSALLRAARLHAEGRRPREWGVDARTLASWADAEPAAGNWSLLMALGVALDRGEMATARELLARAGDVREPLVRAEFTTQSVLLEALDGDPVVARARLDGAGTHPSASGYPALAEAAVLLAESRLPEAGEALRRWDRLIESSPPAVRVGNEWAEEIIRGRLART